VRSTVVGSRTVLLLRYDCMSIWLVHLPRLRIRHNDRLLLLLAHVSVTTIMTWYFFLLSFNPPIGWQLSIWNCCKPFFSLLCNCQLLCFRRLALSIVVEVFPRPFFPDIAPSRTFTTNSLCLIVCPIHMSGVYFVKFLKVIFLLSPFEKLHRPLFCLSILFVTVHAT